MIEATHRPGCDRSHSDGNGAPCNTRGPLDRLPVPAPGPTLAELYIIRDAMPDRTGIASAIIDRAIRLRLDWLSGPLTEEVAR